MTVQCQTANELVSADISKKNCIALHLYYVGGSPLRMRGNIAKEQLNKINFRQQLHEKQLSASKFLQ